MGSFPLSPFGILAFAGPIGTAAATFIDWPMYHTDPFRYVFGMIRPLKIMGFTIPTTFFLGYVEVSIIRNALLISQ